MTAINAIENGREVVAVIRSRRAGWSDRSHRLWAALVAAQRVTALISAVSDDRRKEPADPPTRAAMDHMLTQVSLTAADIATCTVIPRGRPDLTALHDAAATVHSTVPSPDGLTGPPLHTALVAAGRARAAKRLLLRVREAVDALDLPEVPSLDIPAPAPPHLMDPLRVLQQQRRMSIVLVEQNLDEAFAVSDRVVVIKSGRVIRKALPAEFADRTLLMDLF